MEFKPVQGTQPLLKLLDPAPQAGTIKRGTPPSVAATVLDTMPAALSERPAASPQQSKLFQILLEVKGERFWAQSPRMLKPGQTLTLQFQNESRLTVTDIKAAPLQNLAQRQLSLALSLQRAPQTLFDMLRPETTPPATVDKTQTLSQLFTQLKDARVPLETITQKGVLQNKLEQSGLFLENKLMQSARASNQRNTINQQNTNQQNTPKPSQPNIAQDYKATLGKLFRQLQQVAAQNQIEKPELSRLQQLGKQVQTLFRGNPAGATIKPSQWSLAPLLQSLTTETTTSPASQQGQSSRPPTPFFIQFTHPTPSTPPTPPTDTNQARKDWVDQLMKVVASSLFRVQANQLHSLTQHAQAQPQEASSPTLLNFELPIAVGQQTDWVHLRIEEDDTTETSRNDDKQQAWRVHLAFDLERLGAITVELTLTQTTAGILFWAHEQATLRLAKHQLPRLENHLTELGLTVTQLETRLGQPPLPKSILNQHLVDVHT